MDLFLTRLRQGDTSVLADLLIYIESAPMPLLTSSIVTTAATTSDTVVDNMNYVNSCSSMKNISSSLQLESLESSMSSKQHRREMYTMIVHFLHKEGRKLYHLTKLTSTPQESYQKESSTSTSSSSSKKRDSRVNSIKEIAKSLHLLPSSSSPSLSSSASTVSVSSSTQFNSHANNINNNCTKKKSNANKGKKTTPSNVTITYTLPPPTAITALRILTIIGAQKHTMDSKIVRNAFLQLGLQACRELCLDSYCILPKTELYYVIKFTAMLMEIFGCLAADLVRERTSIALIESGAHKCIIHNMELEDESNSEDNGEGSYESYSEQEEEQQNECYQEWEELQELPNRNSNTQSVALTPRPPLSPSTPPPPSPSSREPTRLSHNSNTISANNEAHALESSATTTSTTTARIRALPQQTSHNVRSQMYSNICTNWYPASYGRSGNMHASQHITRYVTNPFINGTTRNASPTTYPGRRYLPMPDKPSFVPFAQNPLYNSETSELDKDTITTNSERGGRGDNNNVNTVNVNSNVETNILIWRREEYMKPQIPWPVEYFAHCYGLGCIPQLPVIKVNNEVVFENTQAELSEHATLSCRNNFSKSNGTYNKAANNISNDESDDNNNNNNSASHEKISKMSSSSNIKSLASSQRSSSTMAFIDEPPAPNTLRESSHSNDQLERNETEVEESDCECNIEKEHIVSHENAQVSETITKVGKTKELSDLLLTRRLISISSFRATFLRKQTSHTMTLLERYLHYGEVHYWGYVALSEHTLVMESSTNVGSNQSERVNDNEHLMSTLQSTTQRTLEHLPIHNFTTLPTKMKLLNCPIVVACGNNECYYYFVFADGSVYSCHELGDYDYYGKEKLEMESEYTNTTNAQNNDININHDNDKLNTNNMKKKKSSNHICDTTREKKDEMRTSSGDAMQRVELLLPNGNNSNNNNEDHDNEDRIITLQSSCNNTIAITQHGFVYVWGDNRAGQCLKPAKFITLNTPFRFSPGQRIPCSVALSSFSGVMTFTDGAMATWGEASLLGEDIPTSEMEMTSLHACTVRCLRGMHLLPLEHYYQFVKVYAGPAHMLAITSVGHVFSWGCCESGRLGHTVVDENTNNLNTDIKKGNSSGWCLEPTLIDALRTYCIVAAACGSAHSAVLTREGQVFAFGSNVYGQLGLYQRQCRYLPTMVPSLPCAALSIACGYSHTIVLLEDGDLMACGSVLTCGSGVGAGRELRCFVRINMTHITLSLSSSSTSLISLTRSATLGCPRDVVYIRLNNINNSSYEHNSNSIDNIIASPLPESFTMKEHVRCMVCGLSFMIVLTENGVVYAIGRGEYGQLGISLSHSANLCNKGKKKVKETYMRDIRLPVTKNNITEKSNIAAYDIYDNNIGTNTTNNDYTVEVKEFVTIQVPSETCFQFVCGNNNFVLALDQDGCVYGWGRNVHGILCYEKDDQKITSNNTKKHERATSIIHTPRRLNGYNEIEPIVQIACGDEFIVALTIDGSVFTHGNRKYCGLSKLHENNKQFITRWTSKKKFDNVPSTNNVLQEEQEHSQEEEKQEEEEEEEEEYLTSPQKITSLHDIIRIAAGPRHALAMDVNGILYTWGDAHYSAAEQYNSKEEKEELQRPLLYHYKIRKKLFYYAPIKVKFTQPIRTMSCGPCNSYVITTSNDLYVWGDNSYCQCGATSLRLIERQIISNNSNNNNNNNNNNNKSNTNQANVNEEINAIKEDTWTSYNNNNNNNSNSNVKEVQNIHQSTRKAQVEISQVADRTHCKGESKLWPTYLPTPTLVARNVREAVFNRHYAVVIDYTGAVRISGLVYRNNEEHIVCGFYDEPYSLVQLPLNNNQTTNVVNSKPWISSLSLSSSSLSSTHSSSFSSSSYYSSYSSSESSSLSATPLPSRETLSPKQTATTTTTTRMTRTPLPLPSSSSSSSTLPNYNVSKHRRPVSDVHKSHKWEKTAGSSDMEHLSLYEAPITSSECPSITEREEMEKEEYEKQEQHHHHHHYHHFVHEQRKQQEQHLLEPRAATTRNAEPLNDRSAAKNKLTESSSQSKCMSVTPLYCYGGCSSDHIYMALERNRPTVQQVRTAIKGLQVLPCVKGDWQKELNLESLS